MTEEQSTCDSMIHRFWLQFDRLQKENQDLKQRLEHVRIRDNTLTWGVTARQYGPGFTPSLLEMLRMRLPEWADTEYGMASKIPFEYLSVIPNEMAKEVLVLILKSGQEVLLRDEQGLFPSDKLITQIRLLAP